MPTRIAMPSGAMRKEPLQARSRATTAAILDAAAHILGERGWAGLTTNAVAEIAGVSIGSLYQYFPNKLALIEAVRRRHFDEVLAVLSAAVDDQRSRTDRIGALADGMIAVHSRFPAAHRVLLEESPRAAVSRKAHDFFDNECQRRYEAIVRMNSRRGADQSLGAHVLAGAVAGAVHQAARHGTLRSPAARREIVALIEGYL